MTAVEWLLEQMNKNTWYDESNYPQVNIGVIDFEQAKEMEKKQIIDAWLSAWKNSMLNPLEDKYYQPEAEQYYNETFNK